jgi:hypothetical protein
MRAPVITNAPRVRQQTQTIYRDRRVSFRLPRVEEGCPLHVRFARAAGPEDMRALKIGGALGLAILVGTIVAKGAPIVAAAIWGAF